LFGEINVIQFIKQVTVFDYLLYFSMHEGDDGGNVECILAVLKQIQSTGAAGDFLLYMLQVT